MIKRPRYVEVKRYEEKLPRVMNRLGVDKYYHYYDSEDKAKARNIELENGDAAFIQLVLALEDLARLVERGIYDLQSWIEGMKMFPAPKE